MTMPLADLLAGIAAQIWQDDALCAETDPDQFFSDDDAGDEAAKAICAQCPVLVECRHYALERDERHGVWGGMTEDERDRLRPPRDVREATRHAAMAAEAQRMLAAGRPKELIAKVLGTNHTMVNTYLSEAA